MSVSGPVAVHGKQQDCAHRLDNDGLVSGDRAGDFSFLARNAVTHPFGFVRDAACSGLAKTPKPVNPTR